MLNMVPDAKVDPALQIRFQRSEVVHPKQKWSAMCRSPWLGQVNLTPSPSDLSPPRPGPSA